MRELVRTNNAVLITAIEALLKSAAIPHVVLDQHMSVLEGSLGILPRRILVDDEHHDSARQLLQDAGLTHELRSPDGKAASSDFTEDAVLGGRLRLKQKRKGHRVGHDAILLAAATEAASGDHVIDFGAGVGAAGLALAVRVPGVNVTLVENDAEIAVIADENILRNGLSERAEAIQLDVTAPCDAFAAAGIGPGSADRVLMNPPFNNPGRLNTSPDAGRAAAHVAPDGLLKAWIAAAAWVLHSAGTLTMIWRADGLTDVLEALEPAFGGIAVLPVYGRAGQPAIRIIVRASKGTRAPLAILPGLLLNDAAGKPTAEAEEILRDAQPLKFGS